MPGDFLRRMREKRVGGLAANIRERGQFTPILMRKDNGDVLDGLDRVAACFLLKLTHVPANLVECSDLEAEIIRRETTTQRRHDPDEQRQMSQELIDMYTAEELEKAKLSPPKHTRVGKPVSPRSKAIKRVAADLGLKDETVRKRQYRAKKAVGEAMDPPLNMIGMLVPDSTREGIMAALGLLREASYKASQCLALLTQIETGGFPFPAARLQRLRQDASELAASIRNAKPVALCPYCKGIETIQSGCGGCAATGFILANQEAGVAAEFWDEATPMVLVAGRARSAWDYLPTNEVERDPFGDDT